MIEYISKCNFDELTLYTKVANTFSHLEALFSNFINEQKRESDIIKNTCVAFKHCSEMGKEYSELNMIEYGTTFNCILNDIKKIVGDEYD